MAPSTKKKKAAIKRRKKRALAANIQPSSPTNSQQQEDEEEGGGGDDDLKTHDEKEISKEEEMAGDKEIGESESGKVRIEFPKESGKGDSSSSSSSDSSSDDESDVVKKIRSSKKKVLEEFKEGMSGITNAFSGILPSEDSVEKIVSSVEEKIEGASSIAMPSKETEDKTLPASVAPSYDGGDSSKVPETPESPEKEELLPIVPTIVQPASWKSCCGLFDVLTGSNR